jgi:hypothetical protein
MPFMARFLELPPVKEHELQLVEKKLVDVKETTHKTRDTTTAVPQSSGRTEYKTDTVPEEDTEIHSHWEGD